MKKFLLKAWLLLACLLLGVGSAWAEKITDYSNIVSGKKYYIGATTGTTDYYLSVNGSQTSTSTAGTAVTDNSNGTVFVFEGSGTSWTIKFDGTSNYLGLNSSKDNGKVQVVSSAATFTVSNQSGKLRLTIGNYSVQKNNSGTQFGSYGNTQTDVWLEEVSSTPVTKYNVTVDNNIANGTVTANYSSAAEGTTVTLNATPDSGYELYSWNVTDASSNAITVTNNKFTMPAADVNVSAVFNEIPARPANEVFYESFDTNNGTGGNDDQWSGSIASNKISSDNENWKFVSGSGANKCAKFGAGSALGSATTPAIAASGNFTLTFKAAAWNGSSESTTLKLSATGAILSVSSVTLTKGAWETYNVNITNATEGFTIKFAGNNTSNSRFFLDEVSVVVASAPTSTDITISSVGYATFFDAEHAYVMPDDCEGYVFTVANGLELAYEGEEVVPAGEPLVIYTIDPGTKTLNYTTSSEETYKANDLNALCGAATDMTADQMAAANTGTNYFYGLSLNNAGDAGSVGFYWRVEGGASFAITAGKAYLVLDQSVAGARSGFAFNEETEALESIEMNAATTIYTLNGVKVNELQKGLNIVNGKKVMVK